ncbi:hypothetical protein [Crenothrix polyspora]|uniref:Lipoprotein n=1 Tax=Crenothrix polyspora TaxID=360316 RepID=A0A1R4GYI6_9GAMM|nr:hypothetical protein [Crenothrix polyspora]SJM89028.1 conserved exported hypothetical protein [Crenothrix polyspora]
MKKPYTALILSAIALNLAACATTAIPEKPTEPASQVNNYPTRDRVDYVLNCIAEHGGLNYISQYACGCKIDKIAEQMSFEAFDTAKTFTNLRGVPGESGAAFRDPKQSKDLKKKLKEVEASAEKSCFVK